MTRIDWSRTRDGFEVYDSELARQWRNGPPPGQFEGRGDGSMDYMALPGLYWAKDLGRVWPVESRETHLHLFGKAREVARSLVWGRGWRTARGRVAAFHQRASTRTLFPSAYFAIYLDYWTSLFARWAIEDGKYDVPKGAAKFIAHSEIYKRSAVKIREMKMQNRQCSGYAELFDHLTSLLEESRARSKT